MRFFPLQDGIYNPTVSNSWTREVKPKKKPYSITDKGNYGTVTTKWRPEYKQTLVEIEFHLNRSTWMLYDFQEYPVLGLYTLYFYIDFIVEDRNYRLEPDELIVLDSLNRPALFCFPKGNYRLFLLPYLGMHLHRNFLYMKVANEAVEIIQKCGIN